MFNRYQSSKNSIYYPQSMGFIRQTSPNRFRNTIVGSQFQLSPPISRLRNSFSATTIKFFDQISPNIKQPKQNRKQIFENLKNTLNELQNKISSTKSNLHVKPEMKKKKKQKERQIQYQITNDKNRQTISTQSTNRFAKKTKVSQFITSEPKPENVHAFFFNPYDTKKYSHYYISESLRAANQKNSLAVEHINGSIKMIKSCSQYVNQNFNTKAAFAMQRLSKDKNKKTLVLDLDETLIHCYENLQIHTDLKINMQIQGSKVELGLNLRPYVMTFLKRMAKKFQIVIFTASHQTYANAILDQLDPNKQIISHRLYRHHCIVLPNQLHVKDLRYLKRDLKDIILVDNAAYSYSFQLDNGIPILPFYEGKDYQLPMLQHYLQKISGVQDVRQFNKQYFKLHQYQNYETAQDLIKGLYDIKK